MGALWKYRELLYFLTWRDVLVRCKQALLGQQFPGRYMWVSIGAVVVLLVGGLFYFKRMERVFADVV